MILNDIMFVDCQQSKTVIFIHAGGTPGTGEDHAGLWNVIKYRVPVQKKTYLFDVFI